MSLIRADDQARLEILDLTVHIPDELVARLGGEAVHDELERRALEAFALEELWARRITEVQLRKMLGLAASHWMASSRGAGFIRTTQSKTSKRNGGLSKSWNDGPPCG